MPANAPHAAAGETRQIDVAYLPPKDARHQPLYELLKRNRVLEKLQEFLSPFRLPRRVLMKVEGCDGIANAFSGDGAVTVCYEYLDEIWANVPKETTPEGIAPIDALVGPMVDVFLHEFGHVAFQLLDVPVFGREEDAADQFSAYLMLHLGPDEARRLIAGAAYAFKGDLRDQQVTLSLKEFSDSHGLPAGRFYNLLCIAFGADANLFAGIVKKGYLPVERAIGCEDEYRQVAHAFKRLIGPHIDKDLAKEVMAMKWLPQVSVRPTPHPQSQGPR
jgi:Putative metallopeptidase